MILSIFIFLLIIIIIIVLKNKEQYYNYFKFYHLQFLSKTNACTILKSVKTLNNYNDLDFKIRNINKNKYKNNVYKHYCERLEDFTKSEKLILNWAYEELQKNTPKDLLFIYKDIKIAKYEDGVENNFPHTHKDTMFFSSTYIKNLIPYFNRSEVENMIKSFGAVIIHECIHIWQRRNPEIFYKLYIYYWNFTKVNKINNNKYTHLCRYNPDGPDINWVFSYKDKHILPISLYKENASNIGSVENVGISLTKKGNRFTVENNENEVNNLTNIKIFTDFFKHVNGNNYHPNELSAELISIYYLKEMNISHDNFDNKAYKKLCVWFEEVKKKN